MRLHYSAVIVLVGFIAFAAGSERKRAGQEPPSALERYAEIPNDAIKIPLPSIRQPDDYSCGAAAMMSICKYYGVARQSHVIFGSISRELKESSEA